MLVYRNAQIEDLDLIVQIYNSTVASRMITADTSPITVESLVDWFHQHNHHNRPLWMIEDEQEEIVGWVSFQNFYGRPAYGGTAEISIYLDEKSRGKGFGKIVLSHCITQCKALKIHTLLGYIFAHNQPSIKLFEHAGFKQWAMLPDIAIMDEKEFSLLILGLKI